MRTRTERQKALVKQYLETPKTFGAYRIVNTTTGKSFVGSSRDVDARINRHRFDLKMNADRSSSELQADWNELGADAFAFEILETLDPPDDPGWDPSEDLEALQELCASQVHPPGSTGYN